MASVFIKALQPLCTRRLSFSAVKWKIFDVATIHGITVAMSKNMELEPGWKELLLLLLGAMIGNFGKVVDYWFSKKE